MYSVRNEGKSVAAERFIRTLKTKIYKYMTLLSRNVYIDKLDDTIDQYNRTDRRKINVKSVDLRIMYIFSLIKKLMINILVLEFHNTKVFLLRDTLKISLKKIF